MGTVSTNEFRKKLKIMQELGDWPHPRTHLEEWRYG